MWAFVVGWMPRWVGENKVWAQSTDQRSDDVTTWRHSAAAAGAWSGDIGVTSQLWGTAACAPPLDFQLFSFSGLFWAARHKLWYSTPCCCI